MIVRAAIAGVGLSVDPPPVPAARAGRGRAPHTIRAHGGGQMTPRGGLDGPRKRSSTSQTLPWLHLRGPSGRDVPIIDGLLVGRGAIGLAHSKKISRQHIVIVRGADGQGWVVQRRGANPAVLRRRRSSAASEEDSDSHPVLLQPAPASTELRIGDTISLAGRLPEHTLEVVEVGASPTPEQLARMKEKQASHG